jgi:NADH dehydrogenase
MRRHGAGIKTVAERVKKRILILGAGFAGINVAVHLSTKLRHLHEITVVDVNNYHLFKPMLQEVATGSVEPGHIIQPIRHVMKGRPFTFLQGSIQRIDTVSKTVHLCEDCLVCHDRQGCPIEDFDLRPEGIKWQKEMMLQYDHLVLALGGRSNYYGIKGAQEHAFPINTLEDANRIREHVLHAFAIASRVDDPERRKSILTFAIVGAGPTGLEFASDLHDWIYGTLLEEFRTIDDREIQIYLIEEGKDILPASPSQIRRSAKRVIDRQSITQLTESRVTHVGKDFVQTDRRSIPTFTVIWAAGIKGSELLRDTGLELGSSDRVVVDEFLTAKGMEDVYAIGDCSVYTPNGASQPLPQTGQIAVQEAQYLSKLLSARFSGKSVNPFRYRPLGSAFSTGQHRGLADIMGILQLHGVLGWVVWKLAYLEHLINIRLSPRFLLDWLFDITYDREAARHKF